MKGKVMHFSMFALGAAIGSLVTWKLVKDKYEQMLQEEINYNARCNNDISYSEPSDPAEPTDDGEGEDEEDEEPVELKEYNNLVSSYISDKWKREQVPVKPRPYVIDPDEYGLIEDYEKIELTYYADGFIADDMFEVLEDIDETIGADFAEHFGDYEDDVVHIRNEVRRQDFEILLSLRNFSEFNLSGED